MKIEHLSLEHQVNTFDCGDSDLNDFLQNDAIRECKLNCVKLQ